MESTAITHLYAENKRLNELVVQLVAECHERVSHARSSEVDLLNQVVALREERDSLKSENKQLKHAPSIELGAHHDAKKSDKTHEQSAAKQQLLAKLHDLNSALDGLSSHGSHLHKMVSSFYKISNTTHHGSTNSTSNLNMQSTVTSSISSLLPPLQDETMEYQDSDNEIQPTEPSITAVYDGNALVELDNLQYLLLPLGIEFGTDTTALSGSTKAAEEELALLEDLFEASFQRTKESIPVITLSHRDGVSSSPSSIPRPPPPPPPPPILVSPPPKSQVTTSPMPQKKEASETRGGLLAAIMAIRPDSESRLLTMEKFEKERVEKREEDITDRETKTTPVSHMDRLMRALKRVKVDSETRMAAITQVEQEVQTRSRTVRSDRLITDNMISQQKGQLKKASGGIEALEEARTRKLEALRAQYREESLSLNHSFVASDDIYEYGSSEEEYSDEEEEGGLASIVQGLIRAPSREANFSEGESIHSQDEDYYSEDDEDDTLFESLGQLVHSQFAARHNFSVSE